MLSVECGVYSVECNSVECNSVECNSVECIVSSVSVEYGV